MNRRLFIGALALGPLVASLTGRAQTAARVRRIGWLGIGDVPSPVERQQYQAALRELGWVVGQNLFIDQRYVGNAELLPRVAAEFVRLKVDLIVAAGESATLAAKNATTTIPIVMWSSGDPVAAGLVASLSRPGGNITGYTMLAHESETKGLSLLRELLPGTIRVGELINSTFPYSRGRPKRLEVAYRSLGMQPIYVDLAQGLTPEDAIVALAGQKVQALHLDSDLIDDNAAEPTMRAAMRYALPTLVGDTDLLEAGALMSYQYDLAELDYRGAAFIDRILRGATPPTFRLSKRPGSTWGSIYGLPRRSELRFRRRCCCARTR